MIRYNTPIRSNTPIRIAYSYRKEIKISTVFSYLIAFLYYVYEYVDVYELLFRDNKYSVLWIYNF